MIMLAYALAGRGSRLGCGGETLATQIQESWMPRRADGAHGNRPHSRLRRLQREPVPAGDDERTRLRFFADLDCAVRGLVPLLRVCLEPSRRG
jgi:hypothetical protein